MTGPTHGNKSPTDSEMASIDVPADLLAMTFAVEYNPNCPSPWLVRMPGAKAVIDHKSYTAKPPLMTEDALDFGRTLAQAATNAMARRNEMRSRKAG